MQTNDSKSVCSCNRCGGTSQLFAVPQRRALLRLLSEAEFLFCCCCRGCRICGGGCCWQTIPATGGYSARSLFTLPYSVEDSPSSRVLFMRCAVSGGILFIILRVLITTLPDDVACFLLVSEKFALHFGRALFSDVDRQSHNP